MSNSTRFFFRHLRDGKSLRNNPLTWLALGEAAGALTQPLLVRALRDRLSSLVSLICARPAFASKPERAQRLEQIFHRHILGGEHWSSLAAALAVSRRQFFRERKLLCDELCASLQLGPLAAESSVLVQPGPEQLALNRAYLAMAAGDLESADQFLEDLCQSLPPGRARWKALLLSANCALQRLRFERAATRCDLASAEADGFETFEERASGSADVNLTRSLYYFELSDYSQANVEIVQAQRTLSRLQTPPDASHSELLRALMVRQAELAIHLGDLSRALELVRRCKYSSRANGAVPEGAFDFASVEAATESFAGRFDSALALLDEAFASAQRLGFNSQVLRFAIERAWLKRVINPGDGLRLARELAILADSLHVPSLTVEAALFCAGNETPRSAFEYATQARAAVPLRSMTMMRAVHLQALASFKLGRVVDALDLADEVEKLSERQHNNRMRACSLALMAHINLKNGNAKAGLVLKRNAAELLRLYGAAGERSVYAEWAQTS
jgi:tetratricopeptide (TPR) repeat protein